MTWTLQEVEHEVFARNPLGVVVAALTYNPIIGIGKDNFGVSDFQNRVRGAFPSFQERHETEVNIVGPNNLETSSNKSYMFSKSDGSAVISLSADKLSLENLNHTSHTEFLADMSLALDAHAETYENLSPVRLGLRYVNIIRPQEISQLLGREVRFSDLIAADYLKSPQDIVDIMETDTLYMNECTAGINGGLMTLRYGKVKINAEGELGFRFDIDRYTSNTFDAQQATELLDGFVGDIYTLFATCMTDALREWMTKG